MFKRASQPSAQPQPITGQPFRDDDPLFTVIVTDYEPSVSRDFFRRKMACIAAQTCDDFEVVVYHDGPKALSYAEDMAGAPMHPRTEFIVTPTRIGDWGHAARDLGIRAARGRYIIHTNADNVFYPSLIEALKAAITDPEPWSYVASQKTTLPSGLNWVTRWFGKALALERPPPQLTHSRLPQILIYGIIARGMMPYKNVSLRVPALAKRQGLLLGGVPVQAGNTDAMQLVMRRDLWLAEGGWHDRRMDSDGYLYEAFARKYRVLAVPIALGEHW